MWQEHWRYSGALGVFGGKVLRVFVGVSRALGDYFGKLRVFKGREVELGSVEFFWVRDILGGIVDILRRASF